MEGFDKEMRREINKNVNEELAAMFGKEAVKEMNEELKKVRHNLRAIATAAASRKPGSKCSEIEKLRFRVKELEAYLETAEEMNQVLMDIDTRQMRELIKLRKSNAILDRQWEKHMSYKEES
jgi:hypothetical protein